MTHVTETAPATAPCISLNDAMQVDFDMALLDLESDANLYRLQARAETCIAGWYQLDRPLESCEIAWHTALHTLNEAIKKVLTTRYGCND
jgi:hypothetical protein